MLRRQTTQASVRKPGIADANHRLRVTYARNAQKPTLESSHITSLSLAGGPGRLMGLLSVLVLLSVALACSEETYSREPLEGIILIVGDGMGLSMISQASLENGKPLNLERMPVVGLQKTSSESGSVTDSAAAITAMLSGHKTFNEWIGLDARGKPVQSLFEIAKEKNWGTAIISTSSVTHATPAGAFVHLKDRDKELTVAWQLALNPPDILIGGGRDFFLRCSVPPEQIPDKANTETMEVSREQDVPENTSDASGKEGDSANSTCPPTDGRAQTRRPLEHLKKTHSILVSYSSFMESSCDSLCDQGEPVERFIGLLARNHLPPVEASHKLEYRKDPASEMALDSEYQKQAREALPLHFRRAMEPSSRKDFLRIASLRSLRALQSKGRPYLMLIEGSQIDWGGHANRADYAISELMDLDETLGALLRELEGRNVLIVVTADHETGGHAILDGKPGRKQKTDFLSHGHSAEMVPVFARGPGAETFTGSYENTEIFHKLLAVIEASPAISH